MRECFKRLLESVAMGEVQCYDSKGKVLQNLDSEDCEKVLARIGFTECKTEEGRYVLNEALRYTPVNIGISECGKHAFINSCGEWVELQEIEGIYKASIKAFWNEGDERAYRNIDALGRLLDCMEKRELRLYTHQGEEVTYTDLASATIQEFKDSLEQAIFVNCLTEEAYDVAISVADVFFLDSLPEVSDEEGKAGWYFYAGSMWQKFTDLPSFWVEVN